MNLIKRKSVFILGTFVFTFIVIVGCSSSKENYLKDFSSFVSEVESNYEMYTDENWEEKKLEYDKYVDEYYKKVKTKLTDEDHYLIGKLKGKYQSIKFKYETKKIINETSEALKEMEGMIEGVVEEISN
jgi:hypothetical protein